MNCRQAKADIALWIGDDLPDRDRREELRRHVSRCAGCRKHYKRLKGTLQVLEHADREQTYDVSDSVWPELARRIEQQSDPGAHRARFNGWFPFVAMTAACVALETQGPTTDRLAGDPMPGGVFDFSPLFPQRTDRVRQGATPAGRNRSMPAMDPLAASAVPGTPASASPPASTPDSF
jgi:hypothetical protein